MLLAYSDYIYQSEAALSGIPKPELFYYTYGKCPFCPDAIHERKSFADICRGLDGHAMPGLGFQCRLLQCESCGWWEIWAGPVSDMVSPASAYQAILKAFAPSDLNVPIGLLEREIVKHPEVLSQTHPRVLEKLVQSVFSQFFDCRVEHCGRSGDAGIDLLMIDGDIIRAVQVKRRASPHHVELVSEIREFLGASLLAGHRDMLFVTTAARFSRGAINAADRARVILSTHVTRFELVDGPHLVSMIGAVAKTDWEPWRERWDECLREQLANETDTKAMPIESLLERVRRCIPRRDVDPQWLASAPSAQNRRCYWCGELVITSGDVAPRIST